VTGTRWLDILSLLCEADTFGHECWFTLGVEQHKEFYYCFIGDCSVKEEDGWKVLEGKLDPTDKTLFVGQHKYSIEEAIIMALAKAFSRRSGVL